jgi:hypothetical protein
MPAEPGDFDHPDTVYNEVMSSSDEEIHEVGEPQSTLKTTPALTSAGERNV